MIECRPVFSFPPHVLSFLYLLCFHVLVKPILVFELQIIMFDLLLKWLVMAKVIWESISMFKYIVQRVIDATLLRFNYNLGKFCANAQNQITYKCWMQKYVSFQYLITCVFQNYFNVTIAKMELIHFSIYLKLQLFSVSEITTEQIIIFWLKKKKKVSWNHDISFHVYMSFIPLSQ